VWSLQPRAPWLARRWPWLAAAALVILAGFGIWTIVSANAGVPKGPYVAKNAELFATIPAYPEAHLTEEYSGTLGHGDGPEPPPRHYYTARKYHVDAGSSCFAIEAFYRERLEASGWRIRFYAGNPGDIAHSHEINYRRGAATLRVTCSDATATVPTVLMIDLDSQYFG